MVHGPTDPFSAITELGSIKLADTDLDGVLHLVVDLAHRILPRAAEISITLVRDQGPYTAASTGDIALQLDEWQYEQRGGPCLLAAAEKTTVSVAHTATETRWPEWGPRASAAGMDSILSVGLPILEEVSGALNVYGTAPAAFPPDTVTRAQSFAGFAAVALANAHLYATTSNLARHLQAAMANRAVIEQAKGIIMGERRCTAEEAFALLTRVSQDSNRKLRDVAAALVARVQRGQG